MPSANLLAERSEFSRRDFLVLCAILALAAALRFTGLAGEPLWLDEGYSWWDARQPLIDLWTLVPLCDPHPPLYFLLLKGWIRLFGDGLPALRSLSAVFGVATTGVVFLAGRQISARTGWIAGLLFAAAPFQIYFAHEARPYALLCFGASLIVFGALKIADRLTAWSRPYGDPARAKAGWGWAALVSGGVIALWSNSTSVLLTAALAAAFALIFVFDRPARASLPVAVVVGVLILLLWAPYVPELLTQTRGVSSDFWIQKPTLAGVTEEFRYMFGFGSRAAGWWMILFMLCGIAALFRLGHWHKALVLAMLAVLPVVLNLAISVTLKPIFISRALIGVMPAFLVALATGVAILRPRALRIAILAVLVWVHFNAVYGLLNTEHLKEPWDELTARLVQEAGPAGASATGDNVVLVVANELSLSLSYTLTHPPFAEAGGGAPLSIPIHGIPADFPAAGMQARYPSGKCAPSVVGLDLSVVDRAADGHKQVFLITRRNNTYDPDETVRKRLVAGGWVEKEMTIYQPGDLQLYRFTR